ncbi:MAG: sensor histidine kinase, partial [Pseudomonas sp.]|nr:sensor histidine kinase [Pseudomonas sp.]
MSAGEKLFGRLLNRHPPPPPDLPSITGIPGVGLQMHLNAEGRVMYLTGPLRHGLAQQLPVAQAPHLLDFLLPHSSLAIEGTPADWQGQTLDLDFYTLSGQPLHLRGWVQPLADAWLLQLLDIGDLLHERRQARSRDQCQLLATQTGDHLRLCSLPRLPDVLVEQLQSL